ncbi:uncharacterized protein [Palaemon carinicauda]|uniref:uncharacterized protein n=1 Tax=Palaemon carinicauda TaxID=392227 RepID=UPI0035B64F88
MRSWQLKGILGLVSTFLSLLTITPSLVEAKGDKVVCYYASWAHYRTGAAKYTVDDIPVELCTHVIYAFAILDAATLRIKEYDSYLDKNDGLASYRKFIELRHRNPSAKMLLALGGWTDSRTDKYSRLVASPKLRADFVAHAVQFLKGYGFDGLDLDWEYPAYQSSASDKQGFSLWVKELRAAFNPQGLLLTAAVSAGSNVIDQGYDVPTVAAALDQIHVMAYDFHGSWEKQVANHAPLYPAQGQPQELSADFAINHWIKRGAKASKLVLGVPFYGRSWTLAGNDANPGAPASGAGKPGPLLKDAGTMAYYEICSAHEQGGWNKVSDPAGPYLTKGNQWVGYDDINAVIEKAQYAKSKGLGGIMIWDIVMDDYRGTCKAGVNPLLRAIVKTLGNPLVSSSTQAPTERPTTPIKPNSSSARPPVTTAAPGQLNINECKSTGYTRDPSNCSFFYRCLGDQIYYFKCPPELLWNQMALPSPAEELSSAAARRHVCVYVREFAKGMDEVDPLREFRQRFDYPKKGQLPNAKVSPMEADEDCLYFCGFSLGLKPKRVNTLVKEQLDRWAKMGSGTYQTNPNPTVLCDHIGREELGILVGADPKSVTSMNGLSVNLHLLLVSFYQPTRTRYKILIEKGAFCSDRYVMKTQAALRGFDPDEAILEVSPRPGEHLICTDDILQILEKEGNSICVVCLSGVQYYTGQKFDMELITRAAQAKGAYVGWDLAHAIGNVEICLDKWNVDFACWCSNKYLCGGPGGIGGAYLNSKHNNREAVHLKGWWSNKDSTKFEMRQECDTAEGIDAFRIATPSPILVASLKPGLDLLCEAGMERILRKQFLLTGYLEMLIDKEFGTGKDGKPPLVTIATPRDPNQRGSQLSLIFSVPLQEVLSLLEARGVVCDIRHPSVMRVSPIPLYNSFSDVFDFVKILKEVIELCQK